MPFDPRALLVAAACAAAVLADEPEPTPAPAPEAQRDPMRGPKVEDVGVPAANPGFTDAEQMGVRMGPREVPFGLFLRAWRTLGARDAADDVRATPEQLRRVAELIEAHRADVRDFRLANADAYNDARQVVRRLARKQERTTADEAEFRAAQQAIRELDASAPTSAAMQRQTLALLTDAQRAYLEQAIERMLEARDVERVNASQEERARQRLAAGELTDARIDGLSISDESKRELKALPLGDRHAALVGVMRRDRLRATLEAMRALEGPVSDEDLDGLGLPARVVERLRDLTPAQRQAAMQRLIARFVTELEREPVREPTPAPSPKAAPRPKAETPEPQNPDRPR